YDAAMWSRLGASHPRRMAALKVAYVNGGTPRARVCDSRAQRAERDSWRGTRMAILDRAFAGRGEAVLRVILGGASLHRTLSPGSAAPAREDGSRAVMRA